MFYFFVQKQVLELQKFQMVALLFAQEFQVEIIEKKMTMRDKTDAEHLFFESSL